MFVLLSAFYVVGILICAVSGTIGMLIFADEGRDSLEFYCFKTVFIFSLIFPYGIYKVIKVQLDAADQDI